MNGVLVIDKPAGLTSHDVVNRVRRILRQRAVGHLGTLDPLATGVLPLVTGSLTRLAQFYANAEKTYEGIIRFGFATDTYDAEGEPTTTPQEVRLRLDEVEALAARFRGVIEQIPPPFSAKKIHGVPAYKLARKQKEVVLQPVQVEIKDFDILSVQADRLQFRARVASGTYMRSVAHEMGQALSCGAHLESLRRTAVAEFTLADVHTLESIQAAASPPNGDAIDIFAGITPEGVAENSLPLQRRAAAAASEPRPAALAALFVHPRKLLPQFPSVTADPPAVARILNGRTVNLPELSRARQVKVFSGQSDLIAIATRVAGTLFHAKIVLSGAAPSSVLLSED